MLRGERGAQQEHPEHIWARVLQAAGMPAPRPTEAACLPSEAQRSRRGWSRVTEGAEAAWMVQGLLRPLYRLWLFLSNIESRRVFSQKVIQLGSHSNRLTLAVVWQLK